MATRKASSRTTASRPATTTRVTRAAAARSPSSSTLGETPAPSKAAMPAKKASTRKPLVSRDNVPPPTQKVPKVKASAPVKQMQVQIIDDSDREPIKAFLRIRPNVDETEESATPYLKSLSETTVQMTDLSGSNRIRMHPQAQLYTFNHVFPPETTQPEFFAATTLPLVRDLLQGQNSLLFTYGVTNSGKTYTIQGGTAPDTAGLLPRTLDVVFNSLEGLHSDAPYRPVRLSGVEPAADDSPFTLPDLSDEKAIAAALGELSSQGTDSTSIKVDKNYEYSIWISYAEVYNDKVYDLLTSDSADSEGTSTCPTPRGSNGLPRSGTAKRLPRPTSTGTTWSSLASLASAPSSSDVLLIKRKALPLKNDPESGGKYVAGLKCVRVRTAEDAKRVFRTGNINRRVFGTLTNAVSSRSHGIFTLRAVRVHRGDPSDVSVSRLSIVDLAGSERTKNSQTTGERLKEAGNINKSLMVLGQCMEAMRSNQRRLAATLAAPGRGGLDPTHSNTNVKLTIIPFRHSKLTELFQDFFVGEAEGRAVMIVNVNPYDTGFDENSHVMRFAALAREVTTAPSAAPKASVRQTPTPTGRMFASGKANTPHRRQVTIPTRGTGTKKQSEAHVEIVEEDEEPDEDDEPADLLVDALFAELEDLRISLYESEMRCAIIETETREEVMQEMEARIMDMERVFAKRIKHATEQNEAKTDAKIDMLHQFGAFKANARAKGQEDTGDTSYESIESEYTKINTEEEEEEEEEGEEEFSDNPIADSSGTEEGISDYNDSMQHKPLSKEEKKRLHSGPSVIGLREEDMTIDDMDADETMTSGEASDEDLDPDETIGASSGTVDDSDEEEEEDEEEWVPEPPKSHTVPSKAADKSKSAGGVAKLQKKMDELSLFADELDEDLDEETSPAPKGKRLSSKKADVSSGNASMRRSTRRTDD